MNTPKSFKNWADNRFFHWIDRRVPEQFEHRLHRHNLYTFPTPMGFAYLALAFTVWMLGTNYQNNLILSLSYLQISVFVMAILHTYFNLAGIEVRFLQVSPVVCGQSLRFKLQLLPPQKKGAEGIHLSWRNGPEVVTHLLAGEPSKVFVPFPTQKRGKVSPQKLLIESRLPLGLIRCWSWLRVPAEGVVYPSPVECDWRGSSAEGNADAKETPRIEGEEFYGFKAYEVGQPLHTVAWKHFARGHGLMVKQYADYESQEYWLEWAAFYRGEEVELALSQMAYWASSFSDKNVDFGLRLPGVTLPPDKGDAHWHKVMQALAMFQVHS